MRVVRQLIAKAHELGVLYADDDWSPLSDITLALLLERAGIRWRYIPMEGVTEVVWPPLHGIHIMHLRKGQPYAQRRFAARHGLAHVLAGHALDNVWSREGGPSQEERVADLFALADLMPDRELDPVMTSGMTASFIRAHMMAQVLEFAPQWDPPKLIDSVNLRWALWLAAS